MRSETSPRKCPHPRVLIPELHAFRSRTGRGRLLASSSRGVAPPAAIATVLLTIAVELVARRAGGDDARSYEAAATVEGCAVVGRALCGVARPELGGAHTHAFGRAGAGEELAEGVHVTFCSLRTERGAKEEVARDLRAVVPNSCSILFEASRSAEVAEFQMQLSQIRGGPCCQGSSRPIRSVRITV